MFRRPRSLAKSNDDLVEQLRHRGLVQTPRVVQAMRQVDRARFCRNSPYDDSPAGIGEGQTISAPHMHAMCLEQLKDLAVPGARVLDVGAGSGIMCAYLGHMVLPGGKVIGVDIYPALIEKAQGNIRSACPDLLDNGVIDLRLANGWMGAPQDAPFDAIHVGAAAERVPEELVAQLRPGGRLLVPVGPMFMQELLCIDKDEQGRVTEHTLAGVAYVPLQHTSPSQRQELASAQERRTRSQTQ